jgi:CRISPR/Cas system CSM-associated protein Csm3 (group 7 of RAMP superfamily)
MARWETPRDIAGRVVVTGVLETLTPLHLGTGEPGELVDLPILRDSDGEGFLLPGTSLAGALRNHALRRLLGYGVAEDPSPDAATDTDRARLIALFGAVKQSTHGGQGALIVDDARASERPIEVRDGVQIDPAERLAADEKRFDAEFIPKHTTFSLCFELLLPADRAGAMALKETLALALQGFEPEAAGDPGAIRLGARRTRGFGRCQVASWTAVEYDLTSSAGLLAWLGADHPSWAKATPVPRVAATAAGALGVAAQATDRRRRCRLEATFANPNGLLVRADERLTGGEKEPDATHIRSGVGEERGPVLPGTSLAGALRARARRILRALHPDDRAATILTCLFGPEPPEDREAPLWASRLLVEERHLAPEEHPLVQQRVGIDRFTGGALDTALFAESPYHGPRVSIDLTIEDPATHETGLLLLLLKDLWTADLPVGGTSSVGRGRLRGLEAMLTVDPETPDRSARRWTLAATERGGVVVGEGAAREELQGFVRALGDYAEARDGEAGNPRGA